MINDMDVPNKPRVLGNPYISLLLVCCFMDIIATSTSAISDGNLRLQSMLFLENASLVNSSNVAISIGMPTQLSEYRDDAAFIGWGYPNVLVNASGVPGGFQYACLYQGWVSHAGMHFTKAVHDNTTSSTVKVGFMAVSNDAIHWKPAEFSGPTPYGLRHAFLANGATEFSVVYDDTVFASDPNNRYKMLLDNATVSASGDGVHWHPFGRWTNETIDPGISMYRNPNNREEIVVTSRPQVCIFTCSYIRICSIYSWHVKMAS